MPVSVIGYPLGLKCGEGWPIWKTGHIASDPDIDFQLGRPAFLIDATTCEGMSGAPVVIRNTSGYQTKNGGHILAAGVTTKFIGIYAGRIHKLSEIGRVWRPFLIHEILAGRLFFDAESRRIAPNRNTTCPCNSGKRFKECCGSLAS
jgi:SEC-C motif